MTSTIKGPKDTVTHQSGALDHEGLSEEWLGFEKILGFRPAVNLEGTPEDQRKVLNDGCAQRDTLSLTEELKNEVEARDDEIRSGSHSIPVRIYKKKSSSQGSKPAAVFYHGGGWILGNIQADDIFCRMIALDLDHVVINVEYRLAPEHIYPAAVDDCYDAFRWTLDNASSLGVDKSKVYVTGNSAGGHLAAAVALKVAQSDDPSSLAAQILRIPYTCHPEVFPGKVDPKPTVPIFNDAALDAMANAFFSKKEDWKQPTASPLLADDSLLKKLPPTYIDVCLADPLSLGGIAYAKKLEDNGVPVKLFELEGMPHGSYVLFPTMPSSLVAHKSCMDATEWALNHKK